VVSIRNENEGKLVGIHCLGKVLVTEILFVGSTAVNMKQVTRLLLDPKAPEDGNLGEEGRVG
jgi:hypothetical protein